VFAIDDIRVTGQSEDSISVEWQNPAAVVVDHFRLTATDPRGVQGQHSVQQSQEARTKHTLNGEWFCAAHFHTLGRPWALTCVLPTTKSRHAIRWHGVL
jgi:hypothetical protein